MDFPKRLASQVNGLLQGCRGEDKQHTTQARDHDHMTLTLKACTIAKPQFVFIYVT